MCDVKYIIILYFKHTDDFPLKGYSASNSNFIDYPEGVCVKKMVWVVLAALLFRDHILTRQQSGNSVKV